MYKMSDEQKQKAGSYMNLAYKAFISIAMVILLRSIPIFIYDAAQWQQDIEERTISTIEMRIDLERHMRVWTPEAQADAFHRLEATEHAIQTLKRADSLSMIDRREMRALLSRIEQNTRK